MEALKSFLPSGSHRRNGEVHPETTEPSDIKQALTDRPQLSEWLASELRIQKGKSSVS